MKYKQILTTLDFDLYKRFKRCQAEVGCFHHKHIIRKAIKDWCDEVERKLAEEAQTN